MPQYVLHKRVGFGFRGDPEPWKFRAQNDGATFSKVAKVSDAKLVRGRPHLRDFYACGFEELRRGDGTVIFPMPRHSRKDRRSRNIIRGTHRKMH